MNTIPRELTAPWEQGCRRCQERTIGAFGVDGMTVVVDATPVFGGNLELSPLTVGLRARLVEAVGDVERYVRHQCPNATHAAAAATPKAEDARAAGRMLMPFGKHRGECLDDVPGGYLRWCLENAEIRDPALRRAIEFIVAQHGGEEDEIPT